MSGWTLPEIEDKNVYQEEELMNDPPILRGSGIRKFLRAKTLGPEELQLLQIIEEYHSGLAGRRLGLSYLIITIAGQIPS
jgi:hypothetical protein